MTMKRLTLVIFGLLALTACDPYDPTYHPDYAIRVTPTPAGGVATAPSCPSWATENTDPFDNQPVPQFGCSDARNLAAQVEKPNDLIQPRSMGDMRGVAVVGAIRRYDNNQTRGLITTGAEVNQVATTSASTSASSLTGDVTGGASSGGSTSPSAGAAAAAP
jgi:hypothetical protein